MDISQVCNLCNKQNDQMLMLKCVHDPCINCAATTYAQQIHIKGQSNQVYVCQICGQQTLLDATTVSQLSNLANSYVKSPSKTYGKRPTNQSIQSVQQTRKIEPMSHKMQSISQPTKKVIYYCKDHQEEQVTYYCFNCGENICPECAIHGRHKDHSVKMIKKAIAEVKNDYMEKIGKLTTFQNSIVRGKDNFLRIIKSTNERHIRQKHIISKQFQTMRSSLVMKQKQLLKQLDDVNRSNIQSLTSILQQVNKNYQQSNKVRKTIQSILKYDQVLILQQYKQISTFQTSIKQLSNLTDSIGGKVHALNGQYLVQQVKALGEEVKKVNLKLEEEKVGLLEAMEANSNNTVTSGFRDRDR